MNAWNQWGAAAYPTPLPGYGAPQAAGAPAIPTAAGLPPVAAAAAVPYPAMPGFQAWPYAAAPQAMAPWGAPGAAAPAGQAAAQWDQWNQWHQQYSQWQQHYAAQSVAANSPQTAQAHTTIATPKAGMMTHVQAVAGSTAPTMATSTTTTPAAVSGNVKRAHEAPAEPQTECKKQRMEQPGWNQQLPTPSTSKELEELSEAEKQFDEQFKSWESQFDTWRQQNANHPDIEQYKAYEAKWASWREQLLARREQMKKKREKLTEAASSAGKAEPLSQPPDPIPVMVPSAATPIPHIYPGYTAPGATSTAPGASQYQPQYQQPQSQFMTHYIAPSTPIPQLTKTPGQSNSAPSGSGASDPSSSQQSEFLKSSSSNGIPGLDLLSGGTSQAEVKSMPAVSFASAGQLPIQTPADSKPFDFPPPRQGPGGQAGQSQQGFPNHQAQGNVPGQTPGGIPSGGYPGLMTPSGFPSGGYPNQSQTGAGFQGPPQTGGYQGGFPGQNASGYQNQAVSSGGFPPGGPTPSFQGAPTSGFQSGAPPASGFQVQAPTSGFQQPPGGGYPFLGQPPPGGFPLGYIPPSPYSQGGFQQPNAPPQQGGFPNQPGQPAGFPDPTKGSFPFQQPPGGGAQGAHQQYPSVGGLDPKKLPGLMDNVLPSNYSERPANNAEAGGDISRPSGPPDDPYLNKFPERFGDGNRDRFGDKPPPRFDEPGFNDKDVGYSLPKPKGYFSMQEMSEEEEYEKFHEYQQAIEKDDDDDKDAGRRSRFNDSKSKGFDDSRSSRFDRPSRFDEGKSRFEESRSRDRYEDSKSSRFDDGKPSRFDGTRPSRFDGARPSRFEDTGSNRYPPDDRSREHDNFKRPFENDPQVPPPSMVGGGNMAQASPTKAGRISRWGAPEQEPEREPPSVSRSGEKRQQGGGMGPPYGATPDGSDFRFATIIDYNHSPANLGVPDYFEPLSVIDYTHGLNGIKVEESKKDQWDNKGRGSSVSSPRNWDRDDRGSFGNRSPWADDRSGGPRGGPGGPHMGSSGPHMGSGGPHMGSGGPHMGSGGPHMGASGPHMGSSGPHMGSGGPHMGSGGPHMGSGGPHMGSSGPHMGSGGPHMGSSGPHMGSGGPHMGSGGPDGLRGGSEGQRPDVHRDGPRDGQRGGRPPRWGDLDERDRRRRDDSSSDNRSRSPDRGRQSDRMSGRDDRRDRKESDRDRIRDRSPINEIMQAVPGPPQITEKQIIPIDDILVAPGRMTRPPKLAIFMRGPPGSGKSYLAKLIKDKEVKNGGTAPRILSLDDYFMTDVEKEVVDPDSGRTIKKKIMEYEYEAAMEQKYRDSLNKCFRKTVTDGYFPFIIIDANNDKLSYFDSMVNFCKVRGFAFYMVEMEQDASQCVKKNIHKRSEKDILAIIKGYEESPNNFKILDVRSLLQEASIPEVDMEDSMDTAQSDETQDKPESQEDAKPEEPPAPEQNQDAPPSDNNSTESDKDDNKAAERTGFTRFTITSKWDDLDSSCSKLDRLDGFTSARKPRPTIQDWLQISDEASFVPESASVGSKKRVRWADVEERSKQAKMKAMGFVVGHTDWNRMLDPTSGQSKLTQTKYI